MSKKTKFIVVSFLIIIFVLISINIVRNFEYSDAEVNLKQEHSINIFDDNQNYLIKYEPKDEVSLKSIIGDKKTKNIAVITANGETCEIASDIYIDKDDESIFCVNSDKKNKIENIKGIYLANDFNSITAVYYDAKNYIDNNEKIMVVLLDGFGYNEYKLAKQKGYIPFLNQYFKNTALSVFTPVTNAGYAAIITGQTPDVNGIHNRSFRQMEVESIFGYAIKKEIKSILLEGNIKILNTEIEPELHLDMNKDSDTDDEMFESAINAAKEDYDFIFIHFHGIDDRGHTYGPKSQETVDYIKKVDSYIKKISEVWGRTIILTADHGMHSTEDGGSHGECRVEDMIVPYFIIGE